MGELTEKISIKRMFIAPEEKSFSKAMAWRIDQEIAALIRKAEQQAEELLSANRAQLDLLATTLQTEETLDGEQVDTIIGQV